MIGILESRLHCEENTYAFIQGVSNLLLSIQSYKTLPEKLFVEEIQCIKVWIQKFHFNIAMKTIFQIYQWRPYNHVTVYF